MHFMYLIWIFIIFISLYSGIFFLLLSKDKNIKIPYITLSILTILHIVFTVLTSMISTSQILIYDIHSVCLAILPMSAYALMMFVYSLSDDDNKYIAYVKSFFLFLAIVILDLIIFARPTFDDNISPQLLIYNVLNHRYVFILLAVYYFAIALVTMYRLYILLKQKECKQAIEILILSYSVYFLYIFFINTILYKEKPISIVLLTSFVNLIPLVATLVSTKYFSLLGIKSSSMFRNINENTDESVCILSDKNILYANKNFFRLFFDMDYVDLSNIRINRSIPKAFFVDDIISNKFLKVSVNYKPESLEIIFSKSKYDDSSYLINITDVSFVKNIRQQTKYINDNIHTLINSDKKIAELTEKNKQLEQEARDFIDAQNKKILLETTDHLTGLSNRSFFSQLAHSILEQSDPIKDRHVLLYLDLDDFKNINDTLGHNIGDEVLKYVSNVLKESVPPTSIISRIGGDEFLIFIKHNGLSQNYEYLVAQVAKKIIRNFKKTVTIGDNIINTSCSMGFSVYPSCGKDIETLIKNADIAMYVAKNNGKNCYSIFEETKQQSVVNEFNLTNDMILAIQKEQFSVYYQPQVEIVKGHPVVNTVESLIRWFHPEKGIIPPSVFIPMAERTGYINEIAIWVLKKVCKQITDWNKEGVFVYVSINFSTPKFEKEHLYENIKLMLKETNINPKFIRIELSEKYLVKNVEDTVETLEAIKNLGVQIAIDNFGTEYSSLNYLKYIPVDYIKLDMSFIHGIGRNEKDEAIIIALIELSKNSNIKIIAEGVETKEQYDFLIGHGLTSMQGYYFYKPMTNKEFTNLYRSAGM